MGDRAAIAAAPSPQDARASLQARTASFGLRSGFRLSPLLESSQASVLPCEWVEGKLGTNILSPIMSPCDRAFERGVLHVCASAPVASVSCLFSPDIPVHTMFLAVATPPSGPPPPPRHSLLIYPTVSGRFHCQARILAPLMKTPFRLCRRLGFLFTSGWRLETALGRRSALAASLNDRPRVQFCLRWLSNRKQRLHTSQTLADSTGTVRTAALPRHN